MIGFNEIPTKRSPLIYFLNLMSEIYGRSTWLDFWRFAVLRALNYSYSYGLD